MHPEQNYSAPNSPNDYDFIVNPQAPAKRSLVAGGSQTTRILLVVSLAVILLIGFMVAKSVLSKPPENVAAMTKVLSQQQELVHITQSATLDQKPLNSANQNIAITTELSLTTAKSDLLKYLALQKVKVNPKKIIYPGAAAIDAQLTASIAASTYDPTFNRVLKTQLTEYQQALKLAFNKTKGTKGRELLSKQYAGSVLLLSQLEAQQSLSYSPTTSR